LIVGVTGHQELEDDSAWAWVRIQMIGVLKDLPGPLIGVTSLAIGADQLFAEIVVQLGGQIIAVIPFEGYERTFERGGDLRNYKGLRSIAVKVETVDPTPTNEQAYLLAGKKVVDHSELLVSVWDGETAHGLGGTGDIVEYAIKKGKRLIIVNPVTREVEAHQ
jgi:hypothetical protein